MQLSLRLRMQSHDEKNVPNRVKRLLTGDEKNLSSLFMKAIFAKNHEGIKDFLDKEFTQFLPLQKQSLLRMAFAAASMNNDGEAISLLQEADREYKTNLRVR